MDPSKQSSDNSNTIYTVTVGAGGASRTTSVSGNNGSNSIFSTLEAIGGGSGGGGNNYDKSGNRISFEGSFSVRQNALKIIYYFTKHVAFVW